MQTRFIWASKHQNSVHEYDTMNGFLSQSIRFGDPLLTTRDSSFINGKFHLDDDLIIRNFPSMGASTVDYLDFIEKYVPEDLISQNNFSQLKDIAENFPSDLTSFLGFESRLIEPEPQADYLFAISSLKGERDALANLIKNGNLPETFLNKSEWQNIGNFAEMWSDSNSVLYDKIIGLWLEFDADNSFCEAPIPSIFLQTASLRINNPEDIEKCRWVTKTAIPTLTGRPVSKKVEKFFINTLKKLPDGASVFQVAAMLSRNSEGIRLVIKRIHPDKIVSYLKSLGWADEDKGLILLLNEIKKYSNCIRLHINISDHVDPKIGLECFISPDKYHKGKGWSDFLDYLVKNELCLPNLKSALLGFPGVEQENSNYDFNLDSYMPSVKLPDRNFSKAIVRYISHVKLSYEPNAPIEAKAYTGVRLFGKMEE